MLDHLDNPNNAGRVLYQNDSDVEQHFKTDLEDGGSLTDECDTTRPNNVTTEGEDGSDEVAFEKHSICWVDPTFVSLVFFVFLYLHVRHLRWTRRKRRRRTL